MSTNAKTTKKRKPTASRKRQKPYGARALLVTLTLGGTMMGWAALAQTTLETAQTVAPTADAQPVTTAYAVPAASTTTTIALDPIPTLVPPPSGDVAQVTLAPIPETTVLQPIPAVSRPVISRPKARTRSSR